MVTILEIARESGYSKSTVSAVLSGASGTSRISDATRRLILDTASRLGYVPNQAARALRQRRSMLVAILDTVDFASYSPEIMRGISDVLHQNRFLEMHCLVSEKGLSEQLKMLSAYRPDGWILLGGLSASYLPPIRELIQSQRHVVQVCANEIQRGASGVFIDPYEIGSTAADYLCRKKHRRIIYAANGQGSQCALGFRETLAKYGVDFARDCVNGNGRDDEAYGAVLLREWIDRGKKETAILAYSDMMAGALIAEANRLGVRIPEELSVMGIDDMHFCDFLKPSLTTVHLSQHDRGMRTAQLLVRHIRQNIEDCEIQFMKPHIHERESCCDRTFH